MKRLVRKSYEQGFETMKNMLSDQELHAKFVDICRDCAEDAFEVDPEMYEVDVEEKISEKLINEFDSLVETVIDTIAEQENVDFDDNIALIRLEEKYYGLEQHEKAELVNILMENNSMELEQIIEIAKEEAEAMYLGK